MGAMTKKQFNDGLKAILDGGRDIERAADETHYIHVPTGTKLERTTTWLSDGKPFFLPAQWMGCLPIGSAVDQVIRDYFVDGPESLDYDTYSENVSQGAYDQLMEDLVPYAEKLAEDGWEVHADRVYLYSLDLGVAGEVDLLLSNQKTKQLWICDMKTSRAGLSSFHKRWGKGEPTKLQKYSLQVNTYRVMAEEMGGLPVAKLSLLPLKVWYEAYKASTDECYFEEEILVDISDPLVMKAEFKQKQIEATWEKLFK